jgi:hypothetical protein
LNTASSKIGWLAGFQVQALNTHKVKLPINKNNNRGGNKMKLYAYTKLAGKDFNKVFFACYDGKAVKHRMKVRAELIHLKGNSNAYFSITGEIERRAGNNRWVFESGGAIHDQIAKVMPELKPLLLVHLADENGVPMHCYENAGYWAGHTKWQQLDLVTLARHLRVDQQEALEMLEYIEMYWGELDTVTTPAMAWKDACEHFGYPIRWQQQADEARKMLNQFAQLEEAK